MKDYSFGNYICALRTGLGLSQYQLGNLVGVTDKAVSKWENGDAKPRLSTCYRLAAALGVEIDELLSCNPDKKISARKELNNMHQELWKQAYERLSIFGEKTPALCWSRLAAEEASLRDTDAIQCFDVISKIINTQEDYLAVHALGLPASSFASWLLGGTKINPLPPHYRCPNCGKTEFVSSVTDGFDLPPKYCTCGEELLRDGHDIPFESFVRSAHHGLHISLHVSMEFKPVVAKIIKEYYTGTARVLPTKIGRGNQFRPDDYYVILHDRDAFPDLCDDGFWHINEGNHHAFFATHTYFSLFPGGQLPLVHALQKEIGVIPPAFATYTSEQVGKKLLAYQKENSDRTTAALFPEKVGKNNLIPDVLSSEPYNFALLCKIQGFSRSSNGWYDNGELLVRDHIVNVKSIPVFHEDIFTDVAHALNRQGIRDNGLALQVMNAIKNGCYFLDGMPTSVETVLRAIGLPDWYPEYLKKLEFLIAKGSCLTMLLARLILTWYRINYPDEYARIEHRLQYIDAQFQ